MEYVYPAVFEQNSDGSITITYPDLPGCISEGKTLGNAIYMAQNALTQWIEFLLEAKEPVPIPSDIKSIKPLNNQFINLVRTEIRDNRAIRRTVSIPMWLDVKASEAGVSLSKILQDALKEKLGV
ncbi:type II toxin-antitoxin system HicB family antitoxin [Syntrophomonas wolfei]|jgi:predicted RNase H-like HicB family nuclease|uniref:type II toxin-antitoxin system HicB family antitoxin n=1 Tax=Syntrophomonas wolfei TaxID=863 RepID=UPI0023F03311|nr:type II toxin-antitoxin system HicB family antitoxin [Syntrophomonas wolfei]